MNPIPPRSARSIGLEYLRDNLARSNEPTPGNDDGAMICAQSNHPEGVSLRFLEGSAKFVKNALSLTRWGALASKAVGEISRADQFCAETGSRRRRRCANVPDLVSSRG